MPRELEPWGGDVHLPRWFLRMIRRPLSDDTPERVHERRQPVDHGISVAENVDRAIFGAWSEGHPGSKRRR
jgi:hypothetical protein